VGASGDHGVGVGTTVEHVSRRLIGVAVSRLVRLLVLHALGITKPVYFFKRHIIYDLLAV